MSISWPAYAQTVVAKFQFLRRADDRRVTCLFEELAKELKLFHRRHVRRDRRSRCAAGVRVCGRDIPRTTEQHVEHVPPAVHRAHVVIIGKLLHHGQRRKDVVSGVGVSDSGGTLAVELDEAVAQLSVRNESSREVGETACNPDRSRRVHVRSRSGRGRRRRLGPRRRRLSPSESRTRRFRKSGRCARSQFRKQSVDGDKAKGGGRRR